MMHNSDLNLTCSYTAPAGVQHCSRCHASCTNPPEDLGSKPDSTGHCDLKQIRYWLKTNIISSFKPSQALAPTSLTNLKILGASSSHYFCKSAVSPIPLSFSPSHLWVFWANVLISLVLCTQCLDAFFFFLIFPSQLNPGSNLGLLQCRQILYQPKHQGSPSA